jgi:hypothetical protein
MDQSQTRRQAPGARRPPTLAEPEHPRHSREHYGLWRGVQVTDATLRVGERTFQINDLRRLRERAGRPHPIRRAVLAVAIGQTAVVAFAVAGLVQMNGWTTALGAVSGVQAFATTVLVGVALVRWPTPSELWAVHRGELTMLYRDTDRYEFGKVRRAVERAMISHRLLK